MLPSRTHQATGSPTARFRGPFATWTHRHGFERVDDRRDGRRRPGRSDVQEASSAGAWSAGSCGSGMPFLFAYRAGKTAQAPRSPMTRRYRRHRRRHRRSERGRAPRPSRAGRDRPRSARLSGRVRGHLLPRRLSLRRGRHACGRVRAGRRDDAARRDARHRVARRAGRGRACSVHLPGGQTVTRWSDPTRWRGGAASPRSVRPRSPSGAGRKQRPTRLWALALRGVAVAAAVRQGRAPRLPAPQRRWSPARPLRTARTRPPTRSGRSRLTCADASPALRQYVDGQLLIAAQATSGQRKRALRRGCARHAAPGRRARARRHRPDRRASGRARSVRHGGQVLYRQRVTSVERAAEAGHRGSTRSAARTFAAQTVIFNLPPWDAGRLMAARRARCAAQRRGARRTAGARSWRMWGWTGRIIPAGVRAAPAGAAARAARRGKQRLPVAEPARRSRPRAGGPSRAHDQHAYRPAPVVGPVRAGPARVRSAQGWSMPSECLPRPRSRCPGFARPPGSCCPARRSRSSATPAARSGGWAAFRRRRCSGPGRPGSADGRVAGGRQHLSRAVDPRHRARRNARRRRPCLRGMRGHGRLGRRDVYAKAPGDPLSAVGSLVIQ